MKVDVIVGGLYGDEGKGKVAYLGVGRKDKDLIELQNREDNMIILEGTDAVGKSSVIKNLEGYQLLDRDKNICKLFDFNVSFVLLILSKLFIKV